MSDASAFSTIGILTPVKPREDEEKVQNPDASVFSIKGASTPAKTATIEGVVAQSPDPGRTRSLYEHSIAYAKGLGIPMGMAFQAAKATLTPTAKPQMKTFGQAAVDEWKRVTTAMKIADLSRDLRNSTDEGERIILDHMITDLEKSMPTDDKQQRNRVQQLGLGLVYTVGQQVATIGSQVRRLGTASMNPFIFDEIGRVSQDFGKNALTFRLRDQAKLVSKTITETTGAGRLEGGLAYRNMTKAGVAKEVAGPLSDIVGGINGAIELTSDVMIFGLTAKLFGKGFEKVTGNTVKQVLKTLGQRLGWDGGMTELGLRITAKVAAGTATNFAEEALQEIPTYLAEHAAAIHQVMEEEGKLSGDMTAEEKAEILSKIESLRELDQPLVDRYKALLQEWPQFVAMGLMPGASEAIGGLVDATKKTETATAKKATPKPSEPTEVQTITENIRQTIAAAEAAPQEEVAAYTTRLEQHATEVQTALDKRMEALDQLTELDDTSAGELIDLATLKDEIQERIAPKEKAAEVPAGTVDIRQAVRTALPQLNEREVTASGLLVDFRAKREGKTSEQYVTDTFAPGVFAAPEVARETLATQPGATAAVTFLEDSRAIIHAVEQTDFKALVHEFAHVFGRHLSEQEQQQVRSTFGDGILGEEKWAEAMIRFWQTGETEHTELRVLMTEMADLLRNARTRFDDVIPEETKRVMDSVLAPVQGETAVAGGEGTLYSAKEQRSVSTRETEYPVGFRYVIDGPEGELQVKKDGKRTLYKTREKAIDAAWKLASEIDKSGGTLFNVEPDGENDIDAAFDQAEPAPIPTETTDEAGVVSPDDEPIMAAIEAAEVEQAAETQTVETMAAEMSDLRQQYDELKGNIGDIRKELKAAKKKAAQSGEALTRYRALQKTNAYVAKRVKQMMKKPGQIVKYEYAEKMREIQGTIGKPLPDTMRKLKNRIQKWQEANKGQKVPAALQELLDRKDVNELTVAEVDALAEKVAALRKEGTALRKAKLAADRTRRQNLIAAMTETVGGVVPKLRGIGTEATKKVQDKLARKGKLKVNLATPQRIFEALDGTSGAGKKAGPFKSFLWEQEKDTENKAVRMKEAWNDAVQGAYDRAKLKPTDLVKFIKTPSGIKICKEDVLYFYGAMQDRHASEAVLYGNGYTQEQIDEMVGMLSDREKRWVDDIIDIFSEKFPEMAAVRLDIDNEMTEQVKRYLPIKRASDVGMPYAQELSTENNVRAGIGKAYMQKGMLKQRQEISAENQPSVRTNLLGLIKEAAEKQTAYIAKEEWLRDAQYVMAGKSKESKALQNAIRMKFGDEMLEKVQQYINLRARPQLWDAFEQSHLMSSFMKKLYGKLGTAQLMYKASTVLVQLEGPFRYLERTDVGHLLSGLAQGTFTPKKTLDFIYERSPKMKTMIDSKAIEPVLAAMREAKKLRSPIARTWGKITDVGFAGMRAMNAWTIASGWKATYDAEMAKMERAAKKGKGEIDEAQAIVVADDATYRTQPSGETADRAPIYWTNDNLFRLMLRFTDAANKMLNMVAYDIPQAVKEHHVSRAVGILASVAISSLIVGAVRRKRLPKNGDELLEDALLGVSDLAPFGLGSVGEKAIAIGMKKAGLQPTRAKTYGYQGINIVEPLTAVGEMIIKAAVGEVDSADVWNAASLGLEYSGFPVPAVENVARSVYDWEDAEWQIDLRELIGKVPKEEKD